MLITLRFHCILWDLMSSIFSLAHCYIYLKMADNVKSRIKNEISKNDNLAYVWYPKVTVRVTGLVVKELSIKLLLLLLLL